MKRADLTQGEKTNIFHALLEGSKNGKPARGKMKELAVTYNCNWKCISLVWAESKKLKAQGVPVMFKHKKKEVVRPKIHVPDLEAIKTLSPKKRTCSTDLAKEIPPSKSTIGRWMIEGLLKYHTSSLNPCLSNPSKLVRLRFTLNALHSIGSTNEILFKSMHNVVHVDEKWFNQKKAQMKMIIVPGEEEFYRSGNKQHIPKVSFICAVAKPLYGPEKEVLFDGKIGVWDFTEQVPAARSSVNRPAGTLVTKPLDSINKVVYKDFLITKILEAIMAKWPHEHLGKLVFIQQDNAPTHIKVDDPDYVASATRDGWDIRLICQPANNPDMNINDLGWFRALQTLQHKKKMNNVDELIAAVQQSYEEMPAQTLTNVFMTLQSCMVEVLKAKGHNNYKMPHLGKNSQRIAGNLPENLSVPTELVRDCLLYLMEQGNESDFEDLTESLVLTFLLE